MSQKKSNKLSDNARKRIVDCWLEHQREGKKISHDELAKQFKCTKVQVRYALRIAAEGKLGKKRTQASQARQAETIMNKTDKTAILDNQLHFALAQLEADKKLGPVERVNALEKVVRTQKTMDEHALQLHIKGLNWEVLSSIVRRFQPDADQKEILKIFREEEAKCRINSQN